MTAGRAWSRLAVLPVMSFMFPTRIAPVMGGLLLGVAAGFAVGWSWRGSTSDSVVPSSRIATDRPAPAAVAVVAPAPRPAIGTNWSEPGWTRLRAEPASPARNAGLGALLEALATQAPAQALQLAQTEPNRLLRRQLLESVLRGWARTAPLEAGRWALATDFDFREAALKAVFSSAVAADPDAAIRAGLALAQLPGADVAGCGSHLIVALGDAGDFAQAAQIAGRMEAAADRDGLIGEAYARWASFQPDRAATAALALADPADRTRALQGVIGGWSEADPAAAVDFATSLPSDEGNRDTLVGQALLRWAKTDLKAASDWINARNPSPAMDRGVAAIATQDYMKPDVALSWADSVFDPKLRSEAVATVLRRWATSDVGAAKQYLATSSSLLPDDRQELEGWLATLGGGSD